MQSSQEGEGYLVLCGASRSKTINYNGNLRDYLASLGLQRLQVRDRDSSPEDVVRTLAGRRKRYSSQGFSVVLQMAARPATQKTVMAYDIVRTLRRRSVEQGKTVIGSATLLTSSGQFTIETIDSIVTALADAPKIHEFCRDLHQEFVDAPNRINPSSAAWMGRKVLLSLGGVALAVRGRSGTTWWMPTSKGAEKARDYFEGLGWEFLAFPVQMSDALREAIDTALRMTGAA